MISIFFYIFMNCLCNISTFKVKAIQICIEYLHMTPKWAISPQSKHIINFFTKYLNRIFQLIFFPVVFASI